MKTHTPPMTAAEHRRAAARLEKEEEIKLRSALTKEEKESLWLSLPKVGKLCGFGKTKMYELAKQPGFPASTRGGKLRTTKADFDKWYRGGHWDLALENSYGGGPGRSPNDKVATLTLTKFEVIEGENK